MELFTNHINVKEALSRGFCCVQVNSVRASLLSILTHKNNGVDIASVTVTNSSFQNYTHEDNYTRQTADIPGFKSFTVIFIVLNKKQ